MLKNNPKFF